MDEVFDQYYQSPETFSRPKILSGWEKKRSFRQTRAPSPGTKNRMDEAPFATEKRKTEWTKSFSTISRPEIFSRPKILSGWEKSFPANQRAFVQHEEQNGRSPLQNGEKKNRMDEVFQYSPSAGNIFKTEDTFGVGEEVFPANRSAFVGYEAECEQEDDRVYEEEVDPGGDGGEYERERCRRHMINERMRREKQKNSYSSLRSRLPPRTKSDKNSIIQEAAKEVKEMQRHREELERRNREIEGILAERERGKNEGAKIKLRVANPASGVDSMVEVLKCLKNMGSKTGAIQSNFSAQEFSAVLGIESEYYAISRVDYAYPDYYNPHDASSLTVLAVAL
ncbi:hypothetical protein C3L33_15032, partial [Rhododendron williamsianum]